MLHLLTLHDGRKELYLEMETVVVVGQLAAEVAVAGSPGCRNDGNALGKHRNLQFALQVEDTLFFELTDNLLALAGHVANGVGGVNVGDYP